MKRVLYGTTALVAASLAAGEASAASGLKLGITGFYRNSIGASWGNGPQAALPTAGGAFSTGGLNTFDRQDVSMRQEIRVNFTGETRLDNGISVGVLVGLNGENVQKSGSLNQVNRAYADFSGKFGMIRVGETDSALGEDCMNDPGNVTSNFGVNSPNESYSNVGLGMLRNQFNQTNTPLTVGVAPVGSIGTCYGLESHGNKGNKIEYFSPTFAGFNFGVSFTPQGASRFAGGGLAYGTDVQAPILSPRTGTAANIVSIAADYDHSFEGWTLSAGGGGEWGLTMYTPAGGDNNNKPSWYQGGFQIGIGQWAFGASGAYYVNYLEAGYPATTAGPNDDGWVVTAGINHTVAGVGIGLQGMYSRWGQFGGAASDEELWGLSLNSTYSYGPGISLEAQFAYTSANYGNAALAPFIFGLPPVHALEVDVGTAINF